MNEGKEWEQQFALTLSNNNIRFTQEKSMKHYGVSKSTKGKYDFRLDRACVECKTIGRATNLRLPWEGKKNTALHSHQFKALRKANKQDKLSGLLIEIRDTNKIYWLNINLLDQIIIENGIIAALNNTILNTYAIELQDLQEWVDMYNKFCKNK